MNYNGMQDATWYTTLLLSLFTTYFVGSKWIFDKVYETSTNIIDELYHLPQGMAYCESNFTYWDPKITTFPGLYIVSAVVGLPSVLYCNTYNLRMVNLIASCVNLLLFASILKYIYVKEYRRVLIILPAVNLSILPPLFFFSHVYYTDTLSLTFLLAFWRLCFVNEHKLGILAMACGAVLMRQTNIVWVGMVVGHKLLDILIKSSRVFGNQSLNRMKLSKTNRIAMDIDVTKCKRYYDLLDFFIALKYHSRTKFASFWKFLTFNDFIVLALHSFVMFSFVIFVIKNGSIVVGDKSAHEARLHLPQLLYFLVFYGVFGLPYVLLKFISTMRLIFNNKFKVLIFGVLMAVIVHFNTTVHPYLLADNRHFTFYIWNRWYGKYDYAIYASIPVYIFLLFSLYDNLKDQNCVSFLMPYLPCVTVVLALQRMIEVRYFLIPYILLRLRFVRPTYTIVFLEFVWFMLLNAAAYYVFFTKEVMWQDFAEPQRIMW